MVEEVFNVENVNFQRFFSSYIRVDGETGKEVYRKKVLVRVLSMFLKEFVKGKFIGVLNF